MKNEQQLFDEIGKVMHTYEDAYSPGAWEEFIKTKRRRRGFVYLRIAAAAAVLLMVGYAAWLFIPVKHIGNNNQQTKNLSKPPYIYPKNETEAESTVTDEAIASRKNVEQPMLSGNNGAEKQAAYKQLDKVNSIGIEAPPPIVNRPNEVEKGNTGREIAAVTTVVPDVTPNAQQPDAKSSEQAPLAATAEPRKYERGSQRLSYDSLANLNLNKAIPAVAENKKSKVLSYGLIVSPSVGNQKMNFGTGVEVAYNISKKFAVSSGITYAYVNAGSNRNSLAAEGMKVDLNSYNASYASSPSPSSFATSASRTVRSVQLTLSGLELPLSFQYKTNSGFYISAGLSAMSVIRNNISYDYLDSRTINTSSANSLSSKVSVITETTTQQSPETLSGFIGFYTFSAGKKISFGKGKLNFAPFIKMPFSRVSSENLQLMHGGVQLGFGF